MKGPLFEPDGVDRRPIVPTLQRRNVVLTLQRHYAEKRQRPPLQHTYPAGVLSCCRQRRPRPVGGGVTVRQTVAAGWVTWKQGKPLKVLDTTGRWSVRGSVPTLERGNDHRSTITAQLARRRFFPLGRKGTQKEQIAQKKRAAPQGHCTPGRVRKDSGQFNAQPPRRCPGRRRCTGWRGRPWRRA